MKEKRKKQPTSLLGLSFDGSRMEGVQVRRTNGSVEIKQTFTVALALDPLTGDAELVGREIRNHLNAAGIKERDCAVCLPLNWALTLTVPLPDLGEEDVESFLQIEAERGFPYGLEALSLGRSLFRTPTGQHVTQVAVPLDHVTRLEEALHAAQLRPFSFSFGITALQHPEAESSDGVIALVPGETSIGLLLTCGGGIAVLRTLEGAYDLEGGERRLQLDHIIRELRITLGNLAPELTGTVRRLRIFGRNELADDLAAQLRPEVEPLQLSVEQVRDCGSGTFSVQTPSGTAISPALALSVRLLSGQGGMEFLPPKVSQWKVLAAKYSSGKLVWTSVAASAVVLAVILAFGVQEVLLRYWTHKLEPIKTPAQAVAQMESHILKYRPWHDRSYPALTILSQLTDSFTKNGDVTAKSISIQATTPSLRNLEPQDPLVITCSGTAKDDRSLNQVFANLRSPTNGLKNVRMDGRTGKPPQLRFSIKMGFGNPALASK